MLTLDLEVDINGKKFNFTYDQTKRILEVINDIIYGEPEMEGRKKWDAKRVTKN